MDQLHELYPMTKDGEDQARMALARLGRRVGGTASIPQPECSTKRHFRTGASMKAGDCLTSESHLLSLLVVGDEEAEAEAAGGLLTLICLVETE
jgi:hypothetical protein